MDLNNKQAPGARPEPDHSTGPGSPPEHKQWTKERIENALQSLRFVNKFSGSLGGFSIRTDKDGKVNVRERPKGKRKPPSKAQAAQQKRFKRASAYARKSLADPVKRGIYEAFARGWRISAHNVAMQDYLEAPVIRCIRAKSYTGRRKETIRVEVADSVQLAEVRLVIRDADGRLFERAKYPNPRSAVFWIYATHRSVPSAQKVQIEVTATDLAGNTVSQAISWPVEGQPKVVKPWWPDI